MTFTVLSKYEYFLALFTTNVILYLFLLMSLLLRITIFLFELTVLYASYTLDIIQFDLESLQFKISRFYIVCAFAPAFKCGSSEKALYIIIAGQIIADALFQEHHVNENVSKFWILFLKC